TYNWMTTENSMGFDKCKNMINCMHQKTVQEMQRGDPVISYEVGNEETYTTDWLTNKMIQMIKDNKSKPFCYMLSIPDPHQPYKVRSPYDTMFKPDRELLSKAIRISTIFMEVTWKNC
ncbi:MAG: hypothetical protein RR582_08030, partial [Niameybacter sp.]